MSYLNADGKDMGSNPIGFGKNLGRSLSRKEQLPSKLVRGKTSSGRSASIPNPIAGKE